VFPQCYSQGECMFPQGYSQGECMFPQGYNQSECMFPQGYSQGECTFLYGCNWGKGAVSFDKRTEVFCVAGCTSAHYLASPQPMRAPVAHSPWPTLEACTRVPSHW
jgi:hypothetical protein